MPWYKWDVIYLTILGLHPALLGSPKAGAAVCACAVPLRSDLAQAPRCFLGSRRRDSSDRWGSGKGTR